MKKDVYERLVAEEKELQEKMIKLNAFMNTVAFYGLDDENKFLLRKQAVEMGNYQDTLRRRIEINQIEE